MKKYILIFLTFCLSFLGANELKIASAAGYKKPVLEIVKEFEKEHKKIDAFFGNMKQITSQAKHTNIALIIGDKNYLQTKSKLAFKSFSTVGVGKVVLAFSKAVRLNSLEEIKTSKVKRVAMPQPSKAIYGIAGEQAFKNANLYTVVRDKMYIVATVPQVTAYLLANEVDAGVINLTSALANKQRLGGYIELEQKLYNKIEIVAATNKNCNKKCKEFLEFLQSKKAKSIFTKYGL